MRNHHSARVISAGITLPFVAGSSSFINGDIHQIEKIQQADPGDAGEEVNPAQQHEEVGVEVLRED